MSGARASVWTCRLPPHLSCRCAPGNCNSYHATTRETKKNRRELSPEPRLTTSYPLMYCYRRKITSLIFLSHKLIGFSLELPARGNFKSNFMLRFPGPLSSCSLHCPFWSQFILSNSHLFWECTCSGSSWLWGESSPGLPVSCGPWALIGFPLHGAFKYKFKFAEVVISFQGQSCCLFGSLLWFLMDTVSW